MIDFPKIIIDGYNETITQQTPLVSYFKRMAQINKRDNFVEFEDFFNGCKFAINRYIGNLQSQYYKELEEHDYAIEMLKEGKMYNSDNILITDKSDIEKRVEAWENQRMYVEKEGISRYRCNISEKAYPLWLYYSDIVKLENDIKKAEQELIPTHNQNKPQQIQLSPDVLKWLQETRCTNGKTYIEQATVNPYAWNWLQSKELARLLLTHPKININNLKGKELANQVSILFYYPKDNKPLKLAKPKKRKGDIIPPDTKTLTKFLATL